MKINIPFLIFTYISFSFFYSCKTSFDDPRYSDGNADLTSYVALGDGFTAGFQDGALYLDGQKNSYPAMLYKQFKNVSHQPDFNIPYLTADDATLGVNPEPTLMNAYQTSSKFVLGYSANCNGVSELFVTLASPFNNNNVNFYSSSVYVAGKPFHNLGVPHAKSFDLLQQTFGGPVLLGGNPFYTRFASIQGTSKVLDDALLANPTFFTLWIGNTDVLNYAISGGRGNGLGGMDTNDITPANTFTDAVNTIIDNLDTNGAKGAIGNIPEITSLPFFTTIPFNGLNIKNQSEADALNAAFAIYNNNAQAAGLDSIIFKPGKNAFVMEDTAAKYQPVQFMRQIKSNELVLLSVPADSISCYGWGSTKPILDHFILDAVEIARITAATKNFNATLKSKATAENLCYVDCNTYFKTLNSGVKFNGVSYNATFINGGAFSLDGINPNMRGYALIANYWITSINAFYKSTIPLLDVNFYPGIKIP